jgi:peptide chain release factor
MLAERLDELKNGDQSRVAVIGEMKRKRKSSAVKKSKRKYKLLEAAKNDGSKTENITSTCRHDSGSKQD